MPTRVKILKDGTTQVDGKPFFLIGARHLPDGGTPQLLRDAGFNGFRRLPFGSEGMGPEPRPENLEGIYFWDYLFDRAVFERSPGHEEELRKHIRNISRHPALLCYENYNEVTMRGTADSYKCTPAQLERGTKVVRSLDPHRPLWMCYHCSNTIEALREFDACADVFGCNPYPIYGPSVDDLHVCRPDGRILDCIDQSIHATGKYTEKMRKVTRGRKPVWMLLQGVANENWGDEKRWRGRPPVYPNCNQIRFMAWDDIVAGAQGLAISMRRTPADGQIWNDIKKVVTELKSLHDVLAGPIGRDRIPVRYTDLGYTIWDGVRTATRRDRTGFYLFAVNTAADPAQVTFRLPAAVRGPATVLSEDRECPVESGNLSDRFEPYAVHLYWWPSAKARRR